MCYQAGENPPHLYNQLKKAEFVDYSRRLPDPSSAEVCVYKSHFDIQFMSNFRIGSNDICFKSTGILWLGGTR